MEGVEGTKVKCSHSGNTLTNALNLDLEINNER
jgi:hypothetical protein